MTFILYFQLTNIQITRRLNHMETLFRGQASNGMLRFEFTYQVQPRQINRLLYVKNMPQIFETMIEWLYSLHTKAL